MFFNPPFFASLTPRSGHQVAPARPLPSNLSGSRDSRRSKVGRVTLCAPPSLHPFRALCRGNRCAIQQNARCRVTLRQSASPSPECQCQAQI